ncbi:uncharacterized protein TNCV_3861851 [Trichonephila clavipes]|nr:uncharacterized protein TNCV_3861851 [Trichonephila clavipes]
MSLSHKYFINNTTFQSSTRAIGDGHRNFDSIDADSTCASWYPIPQTFIPLQFQNSEPQNIELGTNLYPAMHRSWEIPTGTSSISHMYPLKYPDNGVAVTRYALLESVLTTIYGTGTLLYFPKDNINVLVRIWSFYQHRKRRESLGGSLDPYEILTFENYLRCLVLLKPKGYSTSTDITGEVVQYTRAFGNGPRNFELWSSDVDETPELAPPLLTTTPHQREDVLALDRFNVHRCPTRRVFSGTGLKLVTRQAMIRYLYHSATTATSYL